MVQVQKQGYPLFGPFLTLFGKNCVNKGTLKGVTLGGKVPHLCRQTGAPKLSGGIILLTRAPCDRNNASEARGSDSGGTGEAQPPTVTPLRAALFTPFLPKSVKNGPKRGTPCF